MNIDPGIVDMIAKIVAVNAAVTLLLLVMSYVGSALMLEGLAALDRRLNPSFRLGRGLGDHGKKPNQSSPPTPVNRRV
jgi:hypothetical protein